MFSRTENIAKLEVALMPEGPFLVKAREGLDPTHPDMEFVRLTTPYGESIYVPGSSVKGVVRSAAEALLQALGKEVCDASDTSGICPRLKRNLQDRRTRKLPYDQHCDICKTFGSTDLASRVTFGDLFPWKLEDEEAKRIEAVQKLRDRLSVRYGISIDRRKGSVAHGPFEMEVLCGGSLYGEVIVRNYGLWQLGMLLFVIDRIDDGTLRLGFGKSRGLGRVQLQLEKMVVEQFGRLYAETDTLKGAGNDDGTLKLPAQVPQTDLVISHRFVLTGGSLKTVKQGIIQQFQRRYGKS